MNDDICADDPYLAEFVASDVLKERDSGPPQTILHPLEPGSDGEIREVDQWGIVVNLSETQVPFMDLTWIQSHGGWSADDWGQFDSLADEEKLELGLPLGLLIVPKPSASEEEWEAEYSSAEPR